jgi:hypothetical protein
MKLRIDRKWFTGESTIGELYIDDVFECFTLEDTIRTGEKVPGKTAIPSGTYKVITDYSNRFKKMMPHILTVNGFDGIRIHAGNTAKDTEGCVLLGTTKAADSIGGSRDAFASFFKKLNLALAKEEVYLEIA